MPNTTFYQQVCDNALSLRDILSDVCKKHTQADGARLFMAGTPLTTPPEKDMLSQWIKPYMFARVFLFLAAVSAILYVLCMAGYQIMLPAYVVLGSMAFPVAILLFFWEMNIPRNIPVYNIAFVFLLGGAVSILFTALFQGIISIDAAPFAPLYEEPAKLVTAMIFLRKPERKYVLNGILIGAAVGAGFAVFESAGYAFTYLSSGMANTVLLNRAFQSFGGHTLWAALYCGALNAVRGDRPLTAKVLLDPRFLKYFFAAFGLHFIWNTDFSIFPLPLFGDVKLVILIVLAWWLMLRVLKTGLAQIVDMSHGQMPAASVAYVLAGTSGQFAGATIPLNNSGKIVLGRDPSRANLVFSSTSHVSGAHCVLQCQNGQLTVTDLGSRNGTFVNGARIAPGRAVPLHSGMILAVGDASSTFSIKRE